ncbi:gephyrin-like molybdotransferase Glp [Neptunomonas qingdaonensis]|uniref:Molybdopterin molybdenumtransferase n=1 Tax=Neptunomonas qingdaonensis TaxID=1045558 RepID=A0A1I2UQF5_9GAMM|nr:gephyrin-like molybdotransferase Glp [Neptunomonas qingdaonensis]SFG77927.1 molybdopterin molybdotransferase [Neptunomonas qingdaonensis]
MSCSCDSGKLQPFESGLAQLVNAASSVQETEVVELQDALGRVLARNVLSTLAVPPADNSAMDGYAVSYKDLAEGKVFQISQRVAAGHQATAFTQGTAVRLFTGSEIPEGADTVIMQEEARLEGEGVRFVGKPCKGDHIRRAGQDISIGDQVIMQGTVLAPQHLGVLASVGVADVSVYRRLRVAVLNTGDELVMLGMPCPQGKIYNSNFFTLSGLLSRLGCDVWTPGIVKDTPEATQQALAKAAGKADLILSSGGVSVGEEDHVKSAVEALGSLSLWRLAIKPGKPLAFGEVKGTPFIGLPGNPSAVLVTFLMLARPYLLKMQGARNLQPRQYQVHAGFDRTKAISRKEFLRVTVTNEDGKLFAAPAHSQSSGVLSSAVMADGLLVVPEQTPVTKGDLLDFIPFAELGAV